jgi:hypothetical protein
MDILIGIELTDSEQHDIIEPFLSIVQTFKEYHLNLYIFSSMNEATYIINELADFDIVEALHSLYVLKCPTLFNDFHDYGFQTISRYYLIESMTTPFSITFGGDKEIEMALLQFDEHIIAKDGAHYFIDRQHQGLIEKIAKAYNITVCFFELDK